MFDGPHACRFCGRFVLEVEGWAESLQAGHRVLAPWGDEPTVFRGPYHWSCVRGSEFRARFRAELLSWVCGDKETVTVRGEDGRLQEVVRAGLGYSRRIASGGGGDVFEHPRFDRWVFAESAGPIHFLKYDQALSVSRGELLRGDGGGRPTYLPQNPGEAAQRWGLAELLKFLRVDDLYREMVEGFAPEYSFWKGTPKGSGYVLVYSLSAIRPVPEAVSAFLQDYLPTYTPRNSEYA